MRLVGVRLRHEHDAASRAGAGYAHPDCEPANRVKQARAGSALACGAASPTEEASVAALALVVCTVFFVSATVMFFCGALIVELRVRRYRWAATH